MEKHALLTDLQTLNHELRASSCGILGMVEVLRHEMLTTRQQNYLENIQQCAERLMDLINQLPTAKKSVTPKPVATAANTLLLIEDDEIVQLASVQLLERLGYYVDIAEEPEEGLQMTLENHYAAVFISADLAEMGGIEVAAKIRKQNKEKYLPIIMTTTHRKEELVTACLAKGADEVVSKPVTKKQFEQLLKRVFG